MKKLLLSSVLVLSTSLFAAKAVFMEMDVFNYTRYNVALTGSKFSNGGIIQQDLNILNPSSDEDHTVLPFNVSKFYIEFMDESLLTFDKSNPSSSTSFFQQAPNSLEFVVDKPLGNIFYTKTFSIDWAVIKTMSSSNFMKSGNLVYHSLSENPQVRAGYQIKWTESYTPGNAMINDIDTPIALKINILIDEKTINGPLLNNPTPVSGGDKDSFSLGVNV